MLHGLTGSPMLGSNPLIQVNPGLMIWTIVCFLVVLFVLKRYAFGPVQQMIDTRREKIQAALDEADRARDEARALLEEHRRLIGQAKTESEEILVEARRVGDAQRERVRAETEEDRQRRLEETRRQIEQATQQALGQIREEVGKLSLAAAEKILRKDISDADQRRLIDEALAEIDFSQLEGSPS
jgi:F-type H+-transporting ATPase subunit b